jgi:cardiolipin synthase (CMP-forming)
MNKTTLNIPNALSLFRIAVVPVVAACFYAGGYWATWIATWVFFLGCVSDWLDGELARRWNQSTAVGKFLDSSADKVMVGGVMLLLVGFQRLDGVWIVAALLIFSREILIAGLREFLALQGVDVAISRMGKWKAAVQMAASGFLIAGPYGELAVPHAMLIGKILFLAATVMTVWSGADYLRAGLAVIRRTGDRS